MAARKKQERIPTGGSGPALEQNPFASSLEGIEASAGVPPPESAVKSKRGPGPLQRVDLRRETKGRGGKAVTVIAGLPRSLNVPGRKALLKRLQTACAAGGSLKGDTLEIQGAPVEKLEALLREEGFRPVRTGGF